MILFDAGMLVNAKARTFEMSPPKCGAGGGIEFISPVTQTDVRYTGGSDGRWAEEIAFPPPRGRPPRGTLSLCPWF